MGVARLTTREPRRALVLGGGGVLGFAWMLGALAALQDVLGVDVREFDLAVGTSAGSVAAGMLGCGLPVEALCRHHQGVPLPEDPVIGYDYDGTGAALPPRPGLRPAAPHLLLDAALHPGRISPLVALSGLLPTGRGTLAPIHELLRAITAEAGFGDRWPDRPRPWVIAVDQAAGRRVVFGRDDLGPTRNRTPRIVRRASLADAVTASCSIPGWYAPTTIDGVPYIDGGVASNASADVLRGTAVDEVFVLVPMGGRGRTRPHSVLEHVDRGVRRTIMRTVERDVTALRAQGMRVHVLAPGAAELTAMGVNLMDPRTRGDVLESAAQSVAERLRRELSTRRLSAVRDASGGIA
jgi:NTE family protein